MSPRERDASGRPRNARPRDGLGRPLPRSASVGVARVPDDATFTVADGVALADQMLRDDQPFHAHEVLEALWKTRPASERDLWQGLAQLAVGLTHGLRGNGPGAVALLRRGGARVGRYGDDAPYGIDAAGLAAAAARLADRIEADGLAGLDPASLRLELRRG